jgi:FHA domain-containing protein
LGYNDFNSDGRNAVDHLHEIFDAFVQMRSNGLDTKSALNALRAQVDLLTRAQREELAAMLRDHETGKKPAEPKSPKTIPIRPISKMVQPLTKAPAETPPEAGKMTTGEMDKVVWVNCPNCGKPNQQHEVFCYSCGQLLEAGKSILDTRHFTDSSGDKIEKDYFGSDSVLVLRVRGSTLNFELRPQNSDHEKIIGRSSDGSVMTPDVDLKDQKGADLGVSRMHLSVRYDPDDHTILVSDLGSANGTFINGQRIMPKEVRVLRHRDELRLGKMVLMVSFRHPDGTVQPE